MFRILWQREKYRRIVGKAQELVCETTGILSKIVQREAIGSTTSRVKRLLKGELLSELMKFSNLCVSPQRQQPKNCRTLGKSRSAIENSLFDKIVQIQSNLEYRLREEMASNSTITVCE